MPSITATARLEARSTALGAKPHIPVSERRSVGHQLPFENSGKRSGTGKVWRVYASPEGALPRGAGNKGTLTGFPPPWLRGGDPTPKSAREGGGGGGERQNCPNCTQTGLRMLWVDRRSVGGGGGAKSVKKTRRTEERIRSNTQFQPLSFAASPPSFVPVASARCGRKRGGPGE
eukprot:Hpha_TRINITY_DN11254_c0_g1::TRINITY_DN11254_c0_g1_i1::g.167587::m.167587